MEKIEIFKWVKKIIFTSNNDFHFEAVDRLIELFYEKYADDFLRNELYLLREKKWDEIHLLVL
jgi:hypothetical protein